MDIMELQQIYNRSFDAAEPLEMRPRTMRKDI